MAAKRDGTHEGLEAKPERIADDIPGTMRAYSMNGDWPRR